MQQFVGAQTGEQFSTKKHEKNYYEDVGRGCDYLVRCKDCQHLVTYEKIKKLGCCDFCGNRRFGEINLLRQEERDAIASGAISFPDSDKFLAEFTGVE